MMKFWKKSILVQIVGSFSLLSLVIVSLVGYMAFHQARASLKASAFDNLLAIASLKEEELNYWLTDRRRTLIALSQLPEVRKWSKIATANDPSSSEHQSAIKDLQKALSIFIGDRADYQEIFLLSNTGRVLVSTKPNNIGRYGDVLNSSEVIVGQENTFIANFYRSSDTGLPAVTFTISLFDETNRRWGLLAVHLNLDRIDRIIRNNPGLGKTGETYLVADLRSSRGNHYSFVSPQRFGSDEFPHGINSFGIEQAMAGNDDRDSYLNYRQISVIGVYRWLESQNVALLVEIEQDEALAPANQLAYFIALVGLGLAALMTVGIWIVGRQIVKPILSMADGARELSRNVKLAQFSSLQSIPILTENEVGLLGATFNELVQQLQESYEHLQEYSYTLETKVSDRTQELKDKNKYLNLAMKQLQQTQMQLIQNEKMASLGQMVAGIAHEINNPVSFIHSNLHPLDEYINDLLQLISLYEDHYLNNVPAIDIAKEDVDLDFIQADLPKIINSMKIGTTRIQEITIGLRNFSRLDESERKSANLHEGLESTLLIFANRLQAQDNRPEIKAFKNYGDLPKIECYPGQMNQVFLNLIGNAIDALEPGAIAGENPTPTIRISTEYQKNKIIITIADNGPGISAETQAKIFDPFFTTKAIGKGTGLGLSISHSIIVDRHKGELQCFSTPGKGTEFIVSIPI
ncbi:sensor histidine kinase [Roseofilum casamattae]|uniref:histidine kinase n=1 Tax=Roseofilum casamattae BLCC-M143 TaxID=3022442 RepID=A0ABT7BV43_9CYAN|nr:ATP-binding protein [Roseofilum casamattae]MDJ1183060.1 ATP-binding protein [Roseofilum casamattae BLCC-M143]